MVIQDTNRRIDEDADGMLNITSVLPEYVLYINPDDCCIIPHFHIRRKDQEDRDSCQICLSEPRFFNHTTNCQQLDRSTIEELIWYLNTTIDGKTNWKFLVNRWKRTQKPLLQVPETCPDYSVLLKFNCIED